MSGKVYLLGNFRSGNADDRSEETLIMFDVELMRGLIRDVCEKRKRDH